MDLPLRLEKIIVERRPKAIYGNDLVEVSRDDVLLGGLHAEYAQAGDAGDEAVRLSRVRMAAPRELPQLDNPIADLRTAGAGEPPKVLRVTDPTYQYDGTRCHVHFEPVAGAKSYSVWVSPYPDGRGAVELATGWTESGGLIQGLAAGYGIPPVRGLHRCRRPCVQAIGGVGVHAQKSFRLQVAARRLAKTWRRRLRGLPPGARRSAGEPAQRIARLALGERQCVGVA